MANKGWERPVLISLAVGTGSAQGGSWMGVGENATQTGPSRFHVVAPTQQRTTTAGGITTAMLSVSDMFDTAGTFVS